MGKLFFLLDGKTFLAFDGTSVFPATEKAYVPTLLIGKQPEGGGTLYEPINLLGKKWTETFFGKALLVTDQPCKYYLSSTFSTEFHDVVTEIMDKNGNWVTVTENNLQNDYWIFGNAGYITLGGTLSKATPISGTPNIRVTVTKVREGYADRINKCKVACLYGVSGGLDRLFVGGNSDYKNIDHYSEYDNLLYFPDTFYDDVGSAESEIVGYTVYNNYLTAHKSKSNDGRNIIVRSGTLDADGNALFNTVNVVQSEGAVARHGFAYLESEPLFLTGLGIYAVTTSELTGERCSQLRSYYISKALQEEQNLADSFALSYQNFYLLAVNNKIYILDSLQKNFEKDSPYSNYQYECYYFTDIAARVLYEEDGALCFGTSDGKLMRFYSDTQSAESYHDNGAAINAYWEIPEVSGISFYKKKNFRHIALRLASGAQTGAKVSVEVKGIWKEIFDTGARARYFNWDYIDFNNIVFSADRTPKTIGGKIKFKNVDKVRFRIQNSVKNESFGLYSFSLEFTETGNYKG